MCASIDSREMILQTSCYFNHIFILSLYSRRFISRSSNSLFVHFSVGGGEGRNFFTSPKGKRTVRAVRFERAVNLHRLKAAASRSIDRRGRVCCGSLLCRVIIGRLAGDIDSIGLTQRARNGRSLFSPLLSMCKLKTVSFVAETRNRRADKFPRYHRRFTRMSARGAHFFFVLYCTLIPRGKCAFEKLEPRRGSARSVRLAILKCEKQACASSSIEGHRVLGRTQAHYYGRQRTRRSLAIHFHRDYVSRGGSRRCIFKRVTSLRGAQVFAFALTSSGTVGPPPRGAISRARALSKSSKVDSAIIHYILVLKH